MGYLQVAFLHARQPSNSYGPSIVKQLIMNVNERSCQEVSKKSHGEISLTIPNTPVSESSHNGHAFTGHTSQ